MLAIQLDSCHKFLQAGAIKEQFCDIGLRAAFKPVFPIISYSDNAALGYVDCRLGEPVFDVKEYVLCGMTFTIPLRVKVRLIIFDRESSDKAIKNIKEQKVYMGEISLIIESGTFITDGIERIIVSQLHRSPGMLFDHDRGKTHSSGKLLYSARIIPYRGSWLDFESDLKGCVFVRISHRHKLPTPVLLRAFSYSTKEIFNASYATDVFHIRGETLNLKLVPQHLRGEVADIDIKDDSGKVTAEQRCRITTRHANQLEKTGVSQLEVPFDYLIGRVIAKAIVHPITDETIAEYNTGLIPGLLAKTTKAQVVRTETLYTNDIDCGPFIPDTLKVDSTSNQLKVLVEIYRTMRLGESPTRETTETPFGSLFFSTERYDLSTVGRMKFNRRIGYTEIGGPDVLSKEDIIDVLKTLVDIHNGRSIVDDIDHLGNRRVRCVDEMAENRLRVSLMRIERAAKERLSMAESGGLMLQDLINTEPVAVVIKESFGSSQLSQFMDQDNPLSGIIHKRRILVPGLGGPTHERAGFGVRDVHPTHHGRVCPIKTPEGPNIGLINSLATYAHIDKYGLLGSSYRVVKDSLVTDETVFLSTVEGASHVIAQASTIFNEKGQLVDELVTVRHLNEFTVKASEDMTLVDASPRQVVSVVAPLIPFLEHDDANRVLMGSNVQRQAVPTPRANKPLVGTGMERNVACDSGIYAIACRGGTIDSVDTSRAVARVTDDEVETDEMSVNICNLTKYIRSNQSTCINQRPPVSKGDVVAYGDILADGLSTDMGELALGQNMHVAFMPWNGFNSEDSICLSKRMVQEDHFATIHIQELTCVACDIKLGLEEITAGIPNAGKTALSKLDEAGVACVDTEVQAGDILVGKVIPKSET